ncbi:hypothetical protein [Nocardioides limicola]|uniref:hypothetical protein n=1 Tax=Nocardioides limicola TaxID=2803368 RepID=UPI00193B531B|nr:hypothetical protein [Nocardioides sp. DJM-14]
MRGQVKSERQGWRRRLVAVAGLTLVGGGLVACGGSGRAEVGDVVPVSGQVQGRIVDVELPTGRLRFTVGEGQERLTDFDVRDRVDRLAPADGQYVPLSWQYRETYADSWFADAEQPVEVALVVGDVRRDLASLPAGDHSDPEAIFVAVGGDNARVEVSYDGLVQVVDLGAGELEPTDRAVPPGEVLRLTGGPCPVEGWRDQTDPAWELQGFQSCQVTAQVVSYLPGHGWAEPDRAWLGLSVTADAALAYREDTDELSAISDLRWDPRIGDAGPVASLGDVHVFDIDYPITAQLQVDLTLDLELKDGTTLRMVSPGPEWVFD